MSSKLIRSFVFSLALITMSSVSSAQVDSVGDILLNWAGADKVVTDGTYAYVATKNSGLVIVDISDPTDPQPVSYFDSPGQALDVELVGNYIYIADGNSGLMIVDVSDPANPTEEGSVDTPGDAEGISISGSYAYIADDASGLRVIDISDPQNPTEVGSIATPDNAYGVDVSGNYAYVAVNWTGLSSIDISNPASPTLEDTYNTPGRAYDVVVSGNMAYVADHTLGLTVVDITDPAAMDIEGAYNTPGSSRNVAIAGSYAYVADNTSGLRVIDISDPRTPNEVGFYDTPGNAYGVAVSGTDVFISDGLSGLRCVDASTPATPNEVGSFVASGQAYDVDVSGNYAYVADGSSGLKVLDVSDPSDISRVGEYDTPGEARGIVVDGSYVYIADRTQGLRIIDITDPANPSETGFYNPGGMDSWAIAISGNYAYLADNTNGMRIIDISNPAAPAQTGIYNTTGNARGVDISGTFAYVADGSAGMRVLNVSNPLLPFEVGSQPTTGATRGVDVQGNYAYVADGSGGLRVVDISTPALPVEVGSYTAPSAAQSVSISSGGYAYIADRTSGLKVADVSNPAAPVEVGTYDTPEDAWGTAVSAEGYAYVADYYTFLSYSTISSPESFSLLSPVNGSVVSDGDTVLTWEATTDPDPGDNVSYVVWWATDAAFTQDLDSADVGTNTSHSLTGLTDDERYWWKVRAQDTNTTGTWSDETWNFDILIADPPNPFNLVSPADGSLFIVGSVDLDWETTTDPDDNVDHYVVWYATDAGFTQNLDSTTTTFSQITLNGLDDNYTYYWKVRAQDGNTTGRWSNQTWDFDVNAPEAPGAFTLDSPADGSTVIDGDTTLTWNASTDPDPGDTPHYDVWLATSPDMSGANQVADSTSNLNVNVSGLADNTVFYWTVRATDSNTSGTWASDTLSFNTYEPDPPIAFGLNSPADGSIVTGTDTTLTWDASTDPDPLDTPYYDVWLATSADMSGAVLIADSIANTTYDASGLLDDETYYWTVRATDSNTGGTWASDTLSFITNQPDAPTAFNLANPVNGSVVSDNDTTLSWNASTDADPTDTPSYDVWLANAADMSGAVLIADSIAVTSFNVNTLVDDQTYYWTVRATDSNTGGTWASDTLMFLTFTPESPVAFGLQGPVNGSIVTDSDTTLTWDASSDPDPGDDPHYDVWMGNQADLSDAVLIADSIAVTTYNATGLNDDETYYWTVRATDSNTGGTWASDTLMFQTNMPESPTAFTLTSPVNGSVVSDNDTTLSWNGSTDPDPGDTPYYDVWLANAADMSGAVLIADSIAATSFNVNTLVDDQTYYWTVRATDSNTGGTWASDTLMFLTFTPEAPVAFGLQGPANGSIVTDSDTTLTWDASSDPDPGDTPHYDVWMGNQADLSDAVLIADSIAAATYNATGLNDDETYYWTVRATDSNTGGTWASDTLMFQTNMPESPTAFTLTSPVNGSVVSDNDTTLSWNGSTDPDPGDTPYYDVWLANAADMSGAVLIADSIAGTSFNVNTLVDDETYYWTVRATDSNTGGTWASDTLMFLTFTPESPIAFGLLNPTNGSVVTDSDTTLTWEASSDPDPGDTPHYDVWLATSADMSGAALIADSLNATSFNATGLSDDETYYWSVRATDGNTAGTWASDTLMFVTFVPESPTAFNLTSPVSGSIVSDGDTTLTWNASTDADPGDTPYYDVWLGNQADLSDAVLIADSISATNYDVSGLADDQTFYWTVRATDSNTGGTWASDTLMFLTFTPESPSAFNLSSPTNGSVVSDGDTTLTWNASTDPDPADTPHYDVWMGNLADLSDAVLIADSISATNYNVSGLADDQAFYWTVRATDSNTAGTWASDTLMFQTFEAESPTAFNLLGPADGSVVTDSDTTLTWSASTDPDPGDTPYYDVWLSTTADMSGAVLIADSISATTFDATTLTDDQTFYWTVRATDGNTAGTWASDTLSFSTYVPEAPGAFVLTSPTDGSIVSTGDTTLTWNAANDPDPLDTPHYDVWLGNLADLSDAVLVADSISTNNHTLLNLADDMTWYWTVRATDSNSGGTWASDTLSFSTYEPGAPLAFGLTGPAQGSTVVDNDTLLTWDATTDPDPLDTPYYDAWLATMPDLSDAVLIADSIANNFYNVNTLQDDRSYYWTVRATDSNTPGTWASDTLSFNTYFPDAPDAFSLISPADGSIVTTGDTTLTWNATTDPDILDTPYYDVWLATAADMSGATLVADSTANTSFNLVNLDDNETFYWTVRATDSNTSGTWASDTLSFSTNISEEPLAFNLTSPIDGSVVTDGDTTLAWDATTDPDPLDTPYYDVWLGTSVDMSGAILIADSITATNFDVSGLTDDETYYWTVRATDSNTLGTWASDTLSFNIDIPESPNNFTLLSPVDGSVVTTGDTTLTWNGTTDPDPYDTPYYDVWLSTFPDLTGAILVADSTSDLFVNLVNLQDDQTWYWTVRATDSNTGGTWASDTLSFSTNISEQPLAFNLTSPVDGSIVSDGDTTLTWNATTDPDPADTPYYDVWLSNFADMSGAIQVADSISATSYNVSGLADDLDWYWTVRATDSNTGGTWASDTLSFSTDIPDSPLNFNLTGPVNGSVVTDSDTTVTWNATTDHDPYDTPYYDVWLATAPDLSGAVLAADSISTISFDLLNLQDDETYYWTVRATDSNTPGTWAADTLWFSTDFAESPTAFNLTSPVDGSIVMDGDTTLVWNASTDPDPYDTPHYDIWLATTPDMFDQVLIADSISATSFEVENLLDDQTYFWTVRATDSNTGGTWASDTLFFSTDTPQAPLAFGLLSPADGSTVTDGDTTLTWEATTDPDPYDTPAYDVWLGTLPDLSDATRIAQGVAGTSYDLFGLDDDQFYYWTIRATDSNTGGTWASDTLSFNVDIAQSPAGFTLLGPADGSIVTDGDTTITWEATTDPDPYDTPYYDVWLGTTLDLFDAVLVADSIQTTSFELETLVDDRTYYWTVRATDSNTGGTWASDTLSFITDSPQPPDNFTLASPTNGSVVSTGDTTLIWNASNDPDPYDSPHYDVWMGNLPDLSDAILMADSIGVLNLQLINLDDDTEYYWTVRATDSNTPGTWASDTLWFRTDIPESPQAFDLTSPVNGSIVVDGDTTLTWEASIDPDPYDTPHYDVWLGTTEDMFDAILVADSISAVSFDLENLLDDMTYYWTVRATDSNSGGTWASDTLSFSTDTPQPPDNFSLISPADGSELAVTDTTLVWETTTDPDPYDTPVYDIWLGTTPDLFDAIRVGEGIAESSLDITDLIDDVTYYWTVHATDSNTPGTWAADTLSFTIRVPQPPEVFNLTSPAFGSTVAGSDTLLAWDATTDPDPFDTPYYDVWLGNLADLSDAVLIADSIADNSFNVTDLDDDLTYFWTVRATDSNTSGTWSTDTLSFSTYIPNPPEIFNLLSPIDGSVVTTGDTVLVWNITDDPDPLDTPFYDVWLGNLPDLSDALLVADSTSEFSLELFDLEDNQSYYWTVRATDSNTMGTWAADTLSFITNISESPSDFALLSPENGSVVVDGDTTLVWEEAIDPDPLDDPHYDLWIGTTEDFSNAILVADSTDQNFFTVQGLFDDLTYYWTVRATDSNTGGTWSTDTLSFDSNMPEPPSAFNLSGPADGSIVTDGDTLLTWIEAIDPDPYDTTHYDVWMGTTPDLFDAILIADSVMALELEVADLLDDMTYYWTVRATDSNTPGTWATDTLSFNTDYPQSPDIFGLISPEFASVVTNGDTTLTWETTTDPDPYDTPHFDVWMGTTIDMFDALLVADSVAENTFEVTNLQDDQNYYWTVRATDSNTDGTWSTDTLMFLTYVPEGPEPFNLVGPAGGSIVWTGDTTLTWEATTDPDPEDTPHYDVWMGYSPDLSDAVLIADSVDVINLDVVDLDDDSTYFWTVRATDSNTLGTWANDTLSFEVYIPQAPSAFTLVSPLDGEDVHVDEVLVTWNASTDPDPGDDFNYIIEWSLDEDFLDLFGDISVDTFYIITDLAALLAGGADELPFEKFNAKADKGTSRNSGKISVTFESNSSWGIDNNELDELPDDATIYWRVRAEDTFGNITWANDEDTGWSFNVDVPESPLPFSLISPLATDTVWTLDTTFTWEATTDPDPYDTPAYDVWLGNLPDLSDALLIAEAVEDDFHDAVDLNDDAVYFWTVRATDSNTDGTWANDTLSFTTFMPEAPVAFNLVSPDSGASIAEDTVTVTWNSTIDPDPGDDFEYIIEWSLDENFMDFWTASTLDTFFVITDLEDALAGFGNTGRRGDDLGLSGKAKAGTGIKSASGSGSYPQPPGNNELDELPDDATIYWRVRAVDTFEMDTWANGSDDGWSFTVDIPEPPEPFDLAAPVNDSVLTDLTVTLSWFRSSDPDPYDTLRYQVEWSLSEDFAEFDVQDVDEDSFYVLEGLLDDTDYWWRVRVYDINTVDIVYSNQQWHFETDRPDLPSAFNLLAPENGALLSVEDSYEINCAWEQSIDPDLEETVLFDVFYNVVIGEETDTLLSFMGIEDTVLTLHLPDSLDLIYWNDTIDVEWWVVAVSAEDMVECNERFNFQVEPNLLVYEDQFKGIPVKYSIAGTYPNPFNPTMTAVVGLPQDGELNVRVFNVLGKQVAKLANGRFKAGYHEFGFDATGLASGIYFVQAKVPGKMNQLRKIILMK